MSEEEKINYLRLALRLQGFNVSTQHSDQIALTYERLLKLKGKFSVSDAVDIEMAIKRKYTTKEVKEHEQAG